MNNISMNYTRHFERQFSKYGESFKTIGFSSQSQRQRFKILSGIGNLRGKNILDAGCGFGDFYVYLMEEFQIHDYVGIDISSDMVKIARERYPDVSFYHGDILDFEPEMPIDYSLASGVFFLPDPNWEERFVAISRRLFELSKIGVGINLLSIFSSNYGVNKENHYAKPWAILKVVMEKLCKKAVLRHDYRTNDFTIYMYKEDG